MFTSVSVTLTAGSDVEKINIVEDGKVTEYMVSPSTSLSVNRILTKLNTTLEIEAKGFLLLYLFYFQPLLLHDSALNAEICACFVVSTVRVSALIKLLTQTCSEKYVLSKSLKIRTMVKSFTQRD